MTIRNVWAIAANGGLATIVQNLGAASEPLIEKFTMGNCNASEMISDRAGRVYSSTGRRRHGVERHFDPVRNNERLFAEDVSDYLLEKLTNREFSSLVVTGAPRTLGDLRLAFSVQLAQSIIVELTKDYTLLSDSDLPVALQALVTKRRLFL